MQYGILSALRFARSWRGRATVVREAPVEIPTSGEGAPAAATLFTPAAEGPGRGWIVLHGMTPKGRAHPGLRQFVRAVASTGAHVLVPEVREWMELRFAPVRTQQVIRGAVEWLHDAPDIAPGGVMLVGFSFGAPQAIRVAAEPGVGGRLRGVVGWGGYGNLERTLRYCFTGEHVWTDGVHRSSPDPYARWLIGANCLPLVPEIRHGDEVAHALRSLAMNVGHRQIDADAPVHDELKASLRAGLSDEARALFELFVPGPGENPDPDHAQLLIHTLVSRLRVSRELPEHALMEPLATTEWAKENKRIRIPVRLLHGRSDRLIPFSESLYVEASLRAHAMDLSVRILGRFGHSGQETTRRHGPRASSRKLREGIQFIDALSDIFRIS